jgi:hypothetical protein
MLYAGKSCAALDRAQPRDLIDVMRFQQVRGIDRALLDAILVYLLSGDRPIAEMFSPRFTLLAQVFTSEFGGMTPVPVTVKGLGDARRRLVFASYAECSRRPTRSFLLPVNAARQTGSIAHPAAKALPANSMEASRLGAYVATKRDAAVGRPEAVLYGSGLRPPAKN